MRTCLNIIKHFLPANFVKSVVANSQRKNYTCSAKENDFASFNSQLSIATL